MINIDHPINKVFAVVILLFLCFFCWSLYTVFITENESIYKENGIVENTQVFILFITFLAFIIPSFYQNRNDKLIFIFFSLLILNFMLRELDVEEFNLPKILIIIGAGIGKKILLAIGFTSILLYATFDIKHYLHLSNELLRSKAGSLIFTAPVFLFLGGFFEDAQFQHHEYFEEISELTGYILLLLAASVFFNKPLGNKHQSIAIAPPKNKETLTKMH